MAQNLKTETEAEAEGEKTGTSYSQCKHVEGIIFDGDVFDWTRETPLI
jgi:hypothetical protein